MCPHRVRELRRRLKGTAACTKWSCRPTPSAIVTLCSGTNDRTPRSSTSATWTSLPRLRSPAEGAAAGAGPASPGEEGVSALWAFASAYLSTRSTFVRESLMAAIHSTFAKPIAAFLFHPIFVPNSSSSSNRIVQACNRMFLPRTHEQHGFTSLPPSSSTPAIELSASAPLQLPVVPFSGGEKLARICGRHRDRGILLFLAICETPSPGNYLVSPSTDRV